jgi:methylaspartate ammonia-lyase
MNELPQIIAVSAVPGLSPHGEMVWLGLRLADGRTAWAEWADVPDIQAAVQTIQQQVAPLLQDQRLTSFQECVRHLDSLTEKVVVTRPLKPETAASRAIISRRGLITGLLAEEKPKMEQVLAERPLPPTLRFALSQALLNAVAMSRNSTLMAVLAAEYGLAVPDTAVPLHVEATEANIAIIRPILSTHVSALSYDMGTADPKTTLGKDAERLQRHVRQVKEWLAATTTAQPVIHLNLQGGFAELYGLNEGKILGALYGLEQAAKPYRLLVENGVGGQFTAVRQTLQQLHNYLHLRRMTTRLAAGYSLFTPEELRELGDGTARSGFGLAVHHLHLHPAQFGSLHENIQFILTCQERGIGVTVRGEGEMVETAVALTLATRAHTLSGPPDKIYNEIVKIVGNENL